MRAIWMFPLCAAGIASAPAAAAPAMQPVQPPAYDPPAAASPATDSPNEHTEAGLLDLGLALGLLVADGVHDVTIAPSAGRFVAENLELAAVFSVSHTRAADQTATIWSALVEPSYHLPLSPIAFGVLGMAVGAAYEHTLGAGLAIAPRIGLELAATRHGIVTVDLAYAYVTHSAAQARDDAALVALTNALRINLGYSIRW